MYPILWLPLTGNLDNHGLSAITVESKAATFNSGILGNNLVMTTSTFIDIDMTDDNNTTTSGFGISVFCKIDSSVVSGTILELIANDVSVSLGFSDSHLVVWESGQPIRNLSIPVSDFGNWSHIAILFEGTNYHLYINGERVDVFPGTISSPISIGRCRMGGTSDSISGMLFSLKVYGGVPAIRTIINDYLCMVASYKFDGSGMIGDTYIKECDTSGFINDAEVASIEIPLILSDIESKTRNHSVSIPLDNSIKLPIKPDIFFINFWIYLEDGSSSGVILFDDGQLSTSINITTSSLDNGKFAITFAIGEDTYTREIEPLVWYMLSLSYQGDNQLAIYIDAKLEKALSCGFMESNGSYPYIYDGQFRLGGFQGLISDYRQTLYTPTQSDINWIKGCSVVIDNMGTVYANGLVENDGQMFGFTRKGQIVSPSIEVDSSSANEVDAIKYAYTENILTLYDYEEN